LTATPETSLAMTTRIVIAVVGALEDASGHLCELDAVAGDGDHGLTMAEAARNIRTKLSDEPPKDVASLFDLAAAEFAQTGGAMGAVIYVLLQAVGHAAAEIHDELSALDISRLLSVAQDAVSEFGGAQPGDKTIVDSISAARQAANDSADLGASAVEALFAAAQGARKGAEATAGMIARIGRSSRLGELSRGTVDPGAESFAISMEALAANYAMRRPQR
jgi:phosphoenolpyruvate---glycerone phosphotransferase subunit DhaL